MRVNLGLIGFGNVGRKVYELLNMKKQEIESRIGASIFLKSMCDIKKEKIKGLKDIKITDKWQDVVYDKDIDIVVELIGNENVAKDIILESIKNGKHIVTANKDVLATNWNEIFKLANKLRKLVYFESAVCAGIPVIQSLNEGLVANRIQMIAGILNGTTNYILSKMKEENLEFNKALEIAKSKGFAEPLPEKDISGLDTMYKIVILSSIAWCGYVDLKNIYCEGIKNVSIEDIHFLDTQFGYKIKLIGLAERINDEIQIQIRPMLVSKEHTFSTVNDEYNAVIIKGDFSKDIMFYGKGAGGEPAASAVVSDIIFLSRQVATGVAGTLPYIVYKEKQLKIKPVDESVGCYYLRFTTVDSPGVLAKISNILGKNKVSIASVYQKEPLYSIRQGVPILMLTHQTKDGNLKKALREIDKLKIVQSPTIYYKIFDSV